MPVDVSLYDDKTKEEFYIKRGIKTVDRSHKYPQIIINDMIHKWLTSIFKNYQNDQIPIKQIAQLLQNGMEVIKVKEKKLITDLLGSKEILKILTEFEVRIGSIIMFNSDDFISRKPNYIGFLSEYIPLVYINKRPDLYFKDNDFFMPLRVINLNDIRRTVMLTNILYILESDILPIYLKMNLVEVFKLKKLNFRLTHVGKEIETMQYMRHLKKNVIYIYYEDYFQVKYKNPMSDSLYFVINGYPRFLVPGMRVNVNTITPEDWIDMQEKVTIFNQIDYGAVICDIRPSSSIEKNRLVEAKCIKIVESLERSSISYVGMVSNKGGGKTTVNNRMISMFEEIDISYLGVDSDIYGKVLTMWKTMKLETLQSKLDHASSMPMSDYIDLAETYPSYFDTKALELAELYDGNAINPVHIYNHHRITALSNEMYDYYQKVIATDSDIGIQVFYECLENTLMQPNLVIVYVHAASELPAFPMVATFNLQGPFSSLCNLIMRLGRDDPTDSIIVPKDPQALVLERETYHFPASCMSKKAIASYILHRTYASLTESTSVRFTPNDIKLFAQHLRSKFSVKRCETMGMLQHI